MVRLFAGIALLLPSICLAAAPSHVSYQGRLLKSDGTPEVGVVSIDFAFCDSPTAPCSGAVQSLSVALSDGFYSVNLNVTPADLSAPRFLMIKVSGSELVPRQPAAIGPLPGSGNYIQNGSAPQAAGFNISGTAGIGVVAADGRLHIQADVPKNGTGTISSAALTVTGTGTSFRSEIVSGDVIVVGSLSGTVAAVASDTSLTIVSPFSTPPNNSTFSIQKTALRISDSAGLAQVVVSGQGNLGVGTTTPTAKLHVNGIAQVDGSLKVSRLLTGIPVGQYTDIDTLTEYSGALYQVMVGAANDAPNFRNYLLLFSGSFYGSTVVVVSSTAPGPSATITANFAAVGSGIGGPYRLQVSPSAAANVFVSRIRAGF